MVKHNGVYYPSLADIPNGEAHLEPQSVKVEESPKMEKKAVEKAKTPAKKGSKKE